MLFLLAGCAVDPVDDPDLAQTSDALSGTKSNRLECGDQDGKQCETSTNLADNLQSSVTWDPCYGGNFSWTASGSLQAGHDRVCVGGTASAGTGGGCTAGTELTGSFSAASGSATGPITIGLATDASGTSAGLSSLSASCSDSLFIGVYRPVAGASQQTIVRDKSWNDFTSTWTTNSGAGLRLSLIDVWYTADGSPRFDGVYQPGSGDYALESGLSWSQLTSEKQAKASTMELADVAVQQTGGAPVWIGVWRAGTRAQRLYDGTAAGFWTWMQTYTSQGYQPTVYRAYHDSAGALRYTVVVTKTPGTSGWNGTVGVPYTTFARAWKGWIASGWDLQTVTSYVENGVRLYDGIFTPGTTSQDYVPGARWTDFSATNATDTAAGLGLVGFDRVKLASSTSDLEREDKLSFGYPVVAPAWMGQLDSYFQALGGDAMGYAVAVSRNGKLIGASGAGWADDGVTHFDTDSQSDFLSISKMVAGFAALKVAQDAHIDVTTETLLPHIADRLDAASIGAPGSNSLWNVTILQAMTHTSGLKDGGCDDGPGTWETNVNPSNVNGPPGTYSYSGYNPCMLRLFVEEESGMDYETYLDKKLFRPMHIFGLDCVKDSEKTEVLGYNMPPNYYSGGSFPYTEDDHWCADDGIKGSALDLLRILNGVRTSGVFDATSLGILRSHDESFGLNTVSSISGFASAGARGGTGLRTNLAQFPAAQGGTPDWSTGIDAVFFTNSGDNRSDVDIENGWQELFKAYAADPTP